jgi:hydroxylamine reductase
MSRNRKKHSCTIKGVCGKNEEVAKLQDLLIYTLKVSRKLLSKERLISLNSIQPIMMFSAACYDHYHANFDDGHLKIRSKK